MLIAIARRLAEAGVVLTMVSIAVFAMTEAAPGRFLSELQANPRISPQTIALLEARYKLDAPVHERYLAWAASAITGDFGYSALYQIPVSEVLWPRLLNTVRLAVLAMMLAWLIAVPAGVWSGLRANGIFDRTTAIVSSLLLATPDVVAGLAVVWIATSTGWLQIGAIILPAAALSAVTAPVVFRHTRAAVVDAAASRAVIAARLHGLPARTVTLRHVLPLAAVPLVPLFALSVASLLSASLLIEVIVAWPGLGPLMLDAVLGRDLHLLVASAVVSAGLLVVATIGSDVLLRVIDPRVRSAS
jgi:peptide/nickel transport system permease protein